MPIEPTRFEPSRFEPSRFEPSKEMKNLWQQQPV
jgi:hypothetical protein